MKNITTDSDSISLTVAEVGTRLNKLIANHLADTWVLSGEEVIFPLAAEQQTRLLDSLDANELGCLYGYLDAYYKLLNDEDGGLDTDLELHDLTTQISLLQNRIGTRQTKIVCQKAIDDLNDWRKQAVGSI